MHHFKHAKGPYLDGLWVVTVISNPIRYRSRYDLYEKFKRGVEFAGAKLLTVELAFGSRPFEITHAGNPHHVQLRTNTEMWHKENLVNVGISRLPPDWTHVAWVDADIEFMRHDWTEEIVHQLQHYNVIQLFQNAIDMGPMGEVMKVHEGFMWAYVNGKIPQGKQKKYAQYHPGYAWAARRETIDALGGLFDKAILGAGDAHMSWNLINRSMDYAPERISSAYKRELLTWQDRANTHVRQNVGYMPGTIHHHFHGKKKDRRYLERWQILFKHDYDPDQDLVPDWQGVWQFSDKGLRMRSDFQRYFRMRNEDSIEI